MKRKNFHYFHACGINRDIHKLIWISALIKKNKKKLLLLAKKNKQEHKTSRIILVKRDTSS